MICRTAKKLDRWSRPVYIDAALFLMDLQEGWMIGKPEILIGEKK
ncbi:MAG: hypothetical protein RBT80_14910 [Candidatus Vecturithrix sp.]|jgi:hypothetical protein|nr:hypothetical protein [Candidatus Vecturithrix sp.]